MDIFLGIKMKKQQSGFTLIELIMVIVILGILAAVALPKFANLSKDARISSLEGALGAVKAAAVIVHAKSLIDGTEAAASGETATTEGGDVPLVYGYPAATKAALIKAVDLNDFHVHATSGLISASNDGGATAVSDCNFTYAAAASAGAAPAYSALSIGGC